MKIPQTARGALKAAYKLIEKRENWTQGRFKDAIGRFCALGALQEIDGPAEGDAQDRLSAACHRLFKRGTVSVNDSRPAKKAHKKILRAFRLAMKRGRI